MRQAIPWLCGIALPEQFHLSPRRITPREQVERAAQLGYAALALTDECSLAGVVRGHSAAKRLDALATRIDERCGLALKLIIGSEFRLEDGLKTVVLAPKSHCLRGAFCAHQPWPASGR